MDARAPFKYSLFSLGFLLSLQLRFSYSVPELSFRFGSELRAALLLGVLVLCREPRQSLPGRVRAGSER